MILGQTKIFFLVSGFFISGSIRVYSSGDVCQTSHHVDDKPGKVTFFNSHKPPEFFCVASPAVNSPFQALYILRMQTDVILFLSVRYQCGDSRARLSVVVFYVLLYAQVHVEDILLLFLSRLAAFWQLSSC